MIEVFLCPLQGELEIKEIEPGRGIPQILADTPLDAFPDGMLTLIPLDDEPVRKQAGVARIPAGCTVTIHDSVMGEVARVEVHRNGSLPMYTTPDLPCYHHIEGNSGYTALELPDPLNPIVAIWYIADLAHE